jgi:hypothetical protein
MALWFPHLTRRPEGPAEATPLAVD